MVGQDKAAVDRAAAALATDAHPAGGEGGRHVAEAAQPRRALGRGRGDDQRLRPVLAGRGVADGVPVGQGHTGGAVDGVEAGHGPVGVDRPDGRIDAGQDALCLAQGVGEEHARSPGGLVGPPPGIDLGQDLGGRWPAIDGQAEGGLSDERAGGDGLEGRASGVGIGLVVAADDPDFAAVGDAHLGRAEDVAGGMEGDGHAVQVQRLAISGRLDARF